MQTMTRESWTDERLDEFGKRIDERFDRVDERFEKLATSIESMQREMNQRFEGFRRDIFHGLIAICGVMVTGFVGVMGLIVTQV
jgi:hypothetical protein